MNDTPVTPAPGGAIFLPPMSRRTAMKTLGMGGLAMAAGGISLPFAPTPLVAGISQAHAATSDVPGVGDKVVWSACTVNCGSRCPLRMHVQDGVIRWVETDNTGLDEYGAHQVRACARGRSMRRRVYHADRLKYPMKRVGKRGEGKFERITWDEAFTQIAASLQKTIADYGNEAVYINYGTGTLGGTMTRSWPNNLTAISRLMNCIGGWLDHYGTYSTAQIRMGLAMTYGGWAAGNSISDIANTRLVVMFGNNPAETTMSGGGVIYHRGAQALQRTHDRDRSALHRYRHRRGRGG